MTVKAAPKKREICGKDFYLVPFGLSFDIAIQATGDLKTQVALVVEKLNENAVKGKLTFDEFVAKFDDTQAFTDWVVQWRQETKGN